MQIKVGQSQIFMQCRVRGRGPRFMSSSVPLAGFVYSSPELNSSAHCVVPEKIHTHPMEDHWKFLGGGGILKAKLLEVM